MKVWCRSFWWDKEITNNNKIIVLIKSSLTNPIKSNNLVVVRSDVYLSQRSLVGTVNNKALVDPIVSDEILFETVNKKEMEI